MPQTQKLRFSKSLLKERFTMIWCYLKFQFLFNMQIFKRLHCFMHRTKLSNKKHESLHMDVTEVTDLQTILLLNTAVPVVP